MPPGAAGSQPAQGSNLQPDPEPEVSPAPPAVVAYALSLGTLCFPGLFLRQRQLHPFSGPFDWVFSHPRMVAHCVEDDFATFLDPTQYVAVPECPGMRVAAHCAYSPMLLPEAFGGRRQSKAKAREQAAEVIFNHHNPMIPEDHQHFVRATARFTAVMRSPGHKLLLLMSKTPPDVAAAEQLFLTLLGKEDYDGDFELLVIGLQPGCQPTDRGTELLLRRRQQPAAPSSTLQVYVQRCVGGHTGEKFNDAGTADTP
jgi:hypothetical protein